MNEITAESIFRRVTINPTGRLGRLRYRVRFRLSRWRRALAYAMDTMSPEIAADVAFDCEGPAGRYPLATIDAEGVLVRARETWRDHAELPRLAAEAAARVGMKWPGNDEIVYAAEDWAIDLVKEFAAADGVDLADLEDEIYPGWSVADAAAATAEGWNIFECSDGERVIMVDDDAEFRPFDQHGKHANLRAHTHVLERSQNGSDLHRRAIALTS